MSLLQLSSSNKIPVNIFKKMRPSEKLVTIIALLIFIVSGAFLYRISLHTYGTELPQSGGEIREGIIGYARFVNPILAISDADKDLTALVYSGLLRPTPEGKLIPDLAESWTVSEDGLVYAFKLKPGLTFHDGTALTTDDIEFTIQKALDPLVKSPKASNFAGISVQKVSAEEIKFVLKRPYAPFAENLTIGILPKHIWENIEDTAFNVSDLSAVEPVGSGPYRIRKMLASNDGLYENFTLVPFENYALGKPKIETLSLVFFKNQNDAVEAFKAGDIDSIGGLNADIVSSLVSEAGDDFEDTQTPLPRVFGVFFNQNTAPVLLKKEVRKALNMSIDRDALIAQVLHGYGSSINSPIPNVIEQLSSVAVSTSTVANASSTGATSSSSVSFASGAAASKIANNSAINSSTSSTPDHSQNIAEAKKLLETNGWTLGADGIYERKVAGNDPALRLAFTLTTSNSPELKQTADILKAQWKEIGAEIKVEIYESSDLTQKVIRPRKYDALLFGQIVERGVDLYPFWHSSQRNDPGLNISMYANAKADKAIELARSTSDDAKKNIALADFEREIENDIPAVFLYSPNYTYLERKEIKGRELQNMNDPTERFMNVHQWYLETKYRWNFLIKETEAIETVTDKNLKQNPEQKQN